MVSVASRERIMRLSVFGAVLFLLEVTSNWHFVGLVADNAKGVVFQTINTNNASSLANETSNEEGDTSIIVISSLIPSHPSIAIINETIHSLHFLKGLAPTAPLFLAVDGAPQETPQQDKERLAQYVVNLKDAFHEPHQRVLVSDEHLHIAGNIKQALDHVQTRFIYVIQHDFAFARIVNHTAIIKSMKEYPDMLRLVRFNMKMNRIYPRDRSGGGNCTSSTYPVNSINGIHFYKTEAWSDNNHLTTVDYYDEVLKSMIYLRRAPESVLMNYAIQNCSYWGPFMYGKMWDPPALLHLDGRHTKATTTTTTTTTTTASAEKHTPTDVPKIDSSFCSSPAGSLHQVALDMINYSSPPGSPSYAKLHHVLKLNLFFYIDLGPPIFHKIQESIATMLQGYGLERMMDKPTRATNVTLVETMFASSCPIHDDDCQSRARILIQSEQHLKNHIDTCHSSPNCIILEFSDYNFRLAKNMTWGDSLVLLPVMTQQPSRLDTLVPNVLKPLQERSQDVVFFGLITSRRQVLPELSQTYLLSHPNCSNTITKVRPFQVEIMANAYKEAKVCIVAHSYSATSGGEYHRLSEFAPFGCIPVMERFADTIGIERYEQCGRVVFTDLSNLFEAAANVTARIDQGQYRDFSHVDWWKAGIRWESILPSVFEGFES